MEDYITLFDKYIDNKSNTLANKLVDALKDQVCKDIESEEVKDRIIKIMIKLSSSSYCVGYADGMNDIKPKEIKNE